MLDNGSCAALVAGCVLAALRRAGALVLLRAHAAAKCREGEHRFGLWKLGAPEATAKAVGGEGA
eukprot:6208088-Pleurochrysis_carterae.AAC.1